jgi:hypothetical protein
VTLRRIDIGDRLAFAQSNPGARPMLDWVPIEALVIDDAYQRPIDEKGWARIGRIAAAFHWSKFSPMMVAALDGGRFAVIDGQHRAHAAALCGMTHVPALIVPEAAGPVAQAHAFVALNGTAQPLSALGLYRAALVVNEPWAVLLRDTVAAAGMEVATYSPAAGARKPWVIYCIGAVRAFTDAGHAQAVTAALSALRQYDAIGRVGLYDGFLIKPWLGFVQRDPAPVQVLVRILERRDPYKVLEAAQRAAGPGNHYAPEAWAIWSAMKRDIAKTMGEPA